VSVISVSALFAAESDVPTVVTPPELQKSVVKGTCAVVNPAVRSTAEKIVSLRGSWDFVPVTGETIAEWAAKSKLVSSELPNQGSRKINVPGCWESQGVGTPGMGQTWDPLDRGTWELRHIHSGGGIYSRTVKLPNDWNGKRIWLKVGGVRTEAWFYINGKQACYVNNYCGTEKFDITPFVGSSQSVEIVGLVRNDTPSRKGLFTANHKFGGFYRDIELEATPAVWLDDLWVRGDFDKKSADVRWYLGTAGPKLNGFRVHMAIKPNGITFDTEKIKNGYRVRVAIKTLDGTVVTQKEFTSEATTGRGILPIPSCLVWSPEKPNLYVADVSLLDSQGKVLHGQARRFGVRKLEVVGKRFFLNGYPYFIRGMGDHNYDSIHIMEPADRDYFQKHLRQAKAAGFNATRHHTHCPLPEYFDAADEVGFLLEPELPYYGKNPGEKFTFDPLRDIAELHYNYRNHVSFAVYCMGNEGHLGTPIDKELYQWVRKHDPDRLTIHQDGAGKGINNRETSDFTTGPLRPWKPGDCDEFEVPFVAHEYLNLSIKLDPRLESAFTGARVSPLKRAKNLAMLKRVGIDTSWELRCVEAAQRLQALQQKAGIELARRDPACDGFSFWSIIDAGSLQYGTISAQGLFDPFWNPKPFGWKICEFRSFNSPTILLAQSDPPSPIVTEGDRMQLDFFVSHYEPQPLDSAEIVWNLTAGDAKLLSGRTPIKRVDPGFVGSVGNATIAFPNPGKPIKATLRAALTGTNIETRRDFWIFPRLQRQSLKGVVVSPTLFPWFSERFDGVTVYDSKSLKVTDVLICLTDEDAMRDGVKKGCKLLVLGATTQETNEKLGWWNLGTQIGIAFEKSPAFGNFPLSPWMDELWFRLVKHGAADLRAGTSLGTLTPLALGEGINTFFLYVGEARVDSAKVLALYGLDLLQDLPEARCLLDNMLAYVRSDKFKPTAQTHPKAPLSNVPAGSVCGFARLTKPVTTLSLLPNFGWADIQQQVVNCLQKEDEVLSWETAVVTPDLAKASTVSIAWGGALGDKRFPASGKFRLELNDHALLDFDLAAKAPYVWKSKDGKSVLEVEVAREGGFAVKGLYRLTVPKEHVKVNEPQKLTVRAVGGKGDHWFALYPFTWYGHESN
ncbi:MAG: glycoside hydrolase family 2 TIM barrel-domain containing protein, partial [Planctomycetia bacterium]|nr:glycoside hydrolase family 2 TIM barrel-domain containing protein [Planctomycetia bacterium]